MHSSIPGIVDQNIETAQLYFRVFDARAALPGSRTSWASGMHLRPKLPTAAAVSLRLSTLRAEIATSQPARASASRYRLPDTAACARHHGKSPVQVKGSYLVHPNLPG